MDIKSPARSVPKKSASIGDAAHLPTLDLPGRPHAVKGQSKSLAVILAVAIIFLIAAVVVAAVLFAIKQNGEAPTAASPTNNVGNPKKATKVEWIAPATMPANYVWFSQNTDPEHVATYYTDAGAGCSIAARVMPASSNNQTMVAKAGDSEGIATVAAAEGSTLTVADADAEHQYDFKGIETDQTVAVPAIDFNRQSNALFYQQFGEQVASIGYSCKLAAFEPKSSENIALIKQFTVKTEY